MDPKRIVALVVGASVMVLIFSAILVPIVDEATTTEKTFTNEGLWRMAPFEDGDVWSMTAPGVWELNGEPLLTTDNSNSSVLLGDDWTIRGTGAVFGHTAYNASPETVTVTVGEDTTTINTVTINNINGYGINPEGAYIMSEYDKPVYVKGDSNISNVYATGYVSTAGVSFIVHFAGTINDGLTVECSTINNTTALSNFVVSDVEINATPVSGYNDLYKLSGVTFNVTMDYTAGGTTTEKTGGVSFSSYVVPYEVTSEKAVSADSATRALLSAIPIIAMIGIILAVVSVAIVSRNDY